MEDETNSLFVENVLIYLAGYITRLITEKESCDVCFVLLKECKSRVSCELIDQKNFGGLVHPSVDILDIVKFANRKFETIYIKLVTMSSDLVTKMVNEVRPSNP